MRTVSFVVLVALMGLIASASSQAQMPTQPKRPTDYLPGGKYHKDTKADPKDDPKVDAKDGKKTKAKKELTEAEKLELAVENMVAIDRAAEEVKLQKAKLAQIKKISGKYSGEKLLEEVSKLKTWEEAQRAKIEIQLVPVKDAYRAQLKAQAAKAKLAEMNKKK